MHSLHSTVASITFVLVAAVAAGCSVIGGQPEATLAPISLPTTTKPPSDQSADTTSTTPSTPAPTTTAPPKEAVVGPFPAAAPAGACTAEAIRRDFGIAPAGWLECADAWAVTRIEACPPDTECEGVDVFRWTDGGWKHRGMTYSLCVLMVDESGMPRSINDRLLGGNTDCIEPIRYVDEGSSTSLDLGDKGDRTRRVQSRLVEWRLLDDKADGYFGANTRNAVFDFQHLARLPATGVVDEVTMRALGLSWP